MTDPIPLSPASQAVLDAAYALPLKNGQPNLAAALRAAAEQAIPLTKTPWGSTLVPVLSARESRDRLLTIATELENTND